MASMKPIELKVRIVPDEKTMGAVLSILDLWQEANPGKMVAMVPGKDGYVYEIIDLKSGKKAPEENKPGPLQE